MSSPYSLALAAIERRDLRAVDALVAEHVMGWTNLIKLDYATVGEDPRGGHSVPSYSTSIAAAWEVVENLCPNEDEFRLTRFNQQEWQCTFSYFSGAGLAEAETTPLAICLAALKAIGEPE